MFDTTPHEQKMFEGLQALTVSDDVLRESFALEGEARKERKEELAARAKATRSMVQRSTKVAQRVEIVSQLL